jgi:hypothetical protein
MPKPIPGRTCSEPGCGEPAVAQCMGGTDCDRYRCEDHCRLSHEADEYFCFDGGCARKEN